MPRARLPVPMTRRYGPLPDHHRDQDSVVTSGPSDHRMTRRRTITASESEPPGLPVAPRRPDAAFKLSFDRPPSDLPRASGPPSRPGVRDWVAQVAKFTVGSHGVTGRHRRDSPAAGRGHWHRGTVGPAGGASSDGLPNSESRRSGAAHIPSRRHSGTDSAFQVRGPSNHAGPSHES